MTVMMPADDDGDAADDDGTGIYEQASYLPLHFLNLGPHVHCGSWSVRGFCVGFRVWAGLE